MKSRYIFVLCIFLFFQAQLYAKCSGYIVTLEKDAAFFDCSSVLFSAENLYDIENIHDNIYYAENDDVLEELIKTGRVENYEEDQIVYLFDSVPEYKDTYFPKQWYWDVIKADTSRKITNQKSSVSIGMIDSGVCFDHPDMIGADIDDGYDIVNDKSGAEAEFYHGCFAAGIISARANDIGIVGMCDNVKIVPIKCFTDKTSELSNVIKGMYKAIDDYNCDILNMSLGVKSESAALTKAVDYAVSKNVIIVAAVGNEYSDLICYPAGNQNVIGVGAVAVSNGDLIHAPYSQTNSSVYITAPGSSVFSTSYSVDGDKINYTYVSRNGTSFAAPMVSSFLAAAKTLYPQLTVEDAFEMLKESAEDLGDAGYDEVYGYGVINMEKGINYLIKSKGLDEPLHTMPVPSVSELPSIPPVPTVSELPSVPPVPTVSELPQITATPEIFKMINIYVKENKDTIALHTDTEDDADILIIALYDENGSMTNIKICNISLAYNSDVIYNINGSNYKIMLWKGLDSMIPVKCNIIYT